MTLKEFLDSNKESCKETSYIEATVNGHLSASMTVGDMKKLVESGDSRGNLKVSSWKNDVFHRYTGEVYPELHVDLEDEEEESYER